MKIFYILFFTKKILTQIFLCWNLKTMTKKTQNFRFARFYFYGLIFIYRKIII
jgi:hypothetical protein